MDLMLDMLKGNVVNVVVALGVFGFYAPSLEPYHAYLEGIPKRVVWASRTYHFASFSKASDKFKGALNIIEAITHMFSYLCAS